MTPRLLAGLLVLTAAVARADGPADNVVDRVRPVPPPGITLSDSDRAELRAGGEALGKEIDELRAALKGRPALRDLVPDVQVYHNAVRYALTHNEFFDAKEIPVARALLKQGAERARQLRDGRPAWATATGLVVRGYVSKIDGSVQPYGLVVPASYRPDTPHRFRLDCWFHGRGEKLSELNFVDQRQRQPGEFTPPHAFVLHPYGRYCNANKLAGEVDLFEALAHVKKHYPIDEDRVAVRGFSMGGAACWQFAVHYPGLWAAAAPGAGFSETPDFLKVFQNEKVEPTWYEKKLWHLYDCTDYAANLSNVPTVAYSGENDRQKQAADVMAAAMKKEGLELVHVIGPKTGHSYHPAAKAEINRRIDAVMARGRDPVPRHVRFATWTLRYNECFWVTIDQLERHWEPARVDAVIGSEGVGGPYNVSVTSTNVAAITLSFSPGTCPFATPRPRVRLTERGVRDKPGEGTPAVVGPPVLSDRSWTAHFRKADGAWKLVDSPDDGTLHKRHGLQGPIDDAFMDSFLMVRPTGKPLNDKVGVWATKEMAHALDHWRRQFRGEARVTDDVALTEADVAGHNLVLWGDPSSNHVLAKVAARLPLRWDAKEVTLGRQGFDAAHHVPVMIYPNPLNRKRYVVINSGFTFREYDYLNNARQVPKLPDFAVIDANTPPSSRWPGKVVAAGFFDEQWRLPEAAP